MNIAKNENKRKINSYSLLEKQILHKTLVSYAKDIQCNQALYFLKNVRMSNLSRWVSLKINRQGNAWRSTSRLLPFYALRRQI